MGCERLAGGVEVAVRFLAAILLFPCSVIAQALSSPGTDGNYLHVASIQSAFTEGDPHLSFMGWFKTTDSSADLFTWQDTDAPNYGFVFSIGVTTANRMEFLCNSTNSSGSWTTFGASSVFNDGNWTHIAVTWDGANAMFYKNGAHVETVVRAGGLSTHTNTARFFYSNFDGNRPFAGTSQDLRVYKSTLSADDILYDYLALGRGVPVLSSLVVHVWGDFRNASAMSAGTSIRDLSPYQFSISTSGTITSVEGIVLPPILGGY